MEIDSRYMARALQLAKNGLGYASPNPMVGAVIVADGRIIGEGWHRRCGEGHAEVNAVASVREPGLLPHSTMYVTLEPCSHYGKTPPCAKLIIDKKIPRVVVGCLDPFDKVSGRGVQMLRDAGVEVTVGVMEHECRELNKVFMYAHTHGMPYVLLKWACSADGYLDSDRADGGGAFRFSSPLGSVLVHMMRSRCDAVMAGSGTVLADDCRLDVRLVDGRQPLRVAVDRRGRIPAAAAVMHGGRTLYVTRSLRTDLPDNVEVMRLNPDEEPEDMLRRLYRLGVTSLMVEGGAELLRSFIESGLWCEARVEQSPVRLGKHGRARLSMPQGDIISVDNVGNNLIFRIVWR